MNQISNAPYNDITKEAYWCLCNLIEKTELENKLKLIKEKEVIRLFVEMIKESQKDTRIVEIVLVSIEKLLSTAQHFQGNDQAHPLFSFQEEGGCELLEQLQTTPNVNIFALSQRILKTHYPGGDEEGKTSIS